jgi:hypothetical protein
MHLVPLIAIAVARIFVKSTKKPPADSLGAIFTLLFSTYPNQFVRIALHSTGRFFIQIYAQSGDEIAYFFDGYQRY